MSRTMPCPTAEIDSQLGRTTRCVLEGESIDCVVASLLVVVGFGVVCILLGMRRLGVETTENAERRAHLGLPPPPMASMRSRREVPHEKEQILRYMESDPDGRMMLRAMTERQRIWGSEEKVLQMYAVRSYQSIGEYTKWLDQCMRLDQSEDAHRWAAKYAMAQSSGSESLERLRAEGDGPTNEPRVATGSSARAQEKSDRFGDLNEKY